MLLSTSNASRDAALDTTVVMTAPGLTPELEQYSTFLNMCNLSILDIPEVIPSQWSAGPTGYLEYTRKHKFLSVPVRATVETVMPSEVEASKPVNELRSLHWQRSVGMTVLGCSSTHLTEHVAEFGRKYAVNSEA